MDILQIIQDINQYLDRFYWFKAYKFILALYLIIMLVAIILMCIKLYKLGYFTVAMTGQEFNYIPKKGYLEFWTPIVERLQSSNPSEWKVAVIEAADLVDRAFKTIKYPGDTLGEKLEQMNANQVPNLEELKEAVKVRNAVVQQADYQLTQEKAREAVVEFGKVLQFYVAI